jgi:transcription termination factor Rho
MGSCRARGRRLHDAAERPPLAVAVLNRTELEASPLADLHAIAAELGVEGFRRLRREELVGAIVEHADGEGADAEGAGADGERDGAGDESTGEDAGRRARTGGRRGRRGRAAEAERPDSGERPRAGRGGRRPRADEGDEGGAPSGEETTEPRAGVLDVLPNGGGFLRREGFGHGRDDVHVSPAQIRRCELRPGDEVAGPVRSPRRSERHPSLVRVETVNGEPAEPPAERPRFEDLPPAYATEHLTALEELASVPFGKGSRVAIVNPPGAEGGVLLRRLLGALSEAHSELEVTVALAGSRPEDVSAWRAGDTHVVGGGADGSIDDQSVAAELALERSKRVAERGGHALLAVDSLEAMAPDAARRVFAAARRLHGAGSLTVIGTLALSDELARLATTRIVLEPAGGARGEEPSALAATSGTARADLLSG